MKEIIPLSKDEIDMLPIRSRQEAIERYWVWLEEQRDNDRRIAKNAINNIRNKIWRSAHPERVKYFNRKNYEKHYGDHLAYRNKYNHAMRKIIKDIGGKEMVSDWRKANPEKYREYMRKYMAEYKARNKETGVKKTVSAVKPKHGTLEYNRQKWKKRYADIKADPIKYRAYKAGSRIRYLKSIGKVEELNRNIKEPTFNSNMETLGEDCVKEKVTGVKDLNHYCKEGGLVTKLLTVYVTTGMEQWIKQNKIDKSLLFRDAVRQIGYKGE